MNQKKLVCGCCIVNERSKFIPLKSIDYKIKIENSSALVELE